MKIVIADKFEDKVVEEIKKCGDVVYQPADLKGAIADADVLIVRSATKANADLLSSAKKLKAVLRGGVGLDNVDKEYCKSKNIAVFNTPGAATNSVAELAIGLILSLARKIPAAHLKMKGKVWAKKELTGTEINGKMLGILGYGRIGKMVAQKAKALGMTVIAHDKMAQPDESANLVSFDELLAKSDYITLHVPLTPETKGLFNKDSIAKMKKNACIINLARGPVVDEDALYDACKTGTIAGAACDVYPIEPYTGKLLELDNIVFTPHLGADTKEGNLRVGNELAKIIRELK